MVGAFVSDIKALTSRFVASFRNGGSRMALGGKLFPENENARY
jgi:hypothetical protein